MRRALQRAGWKRDGDVASIPPARLLPAMLLVLAACGAAMFVYFLSLTWPPRSGMLLVPVGAVLLMGYAGARGFLRRTAVSFSGGVFRCTSGALGATDVHELALADVDRFEARPPAHPKDVPHLVVRVRSGDEVRLEIPLADFATLHADQLGLELAIELQEMLDEARRDGRTYR